jgi:hypothetical protein
MYGPGDVRLEDSSDPRIVEAGTSLTSVPQ